MNPNIIKFDEPQKVNIIEWALKHPNCDALIKKDNDAKTMMVIAYAINEMGNQELTILAQADDNLGIFWGGLTLLCLIMSGKSYDKESQ